MVHSSLQDGFLNATLDVLSDANEATCERPGSGVLRAQINKNNVFKIRAVVKPQQMTTSDCLRLVAMTQFRTQTTCKGVFCPPNVPQSCALEDAKTSLDTNLVWVCNCVEEGCNEVLIWVPNLFNTIELCEIEMLDSG